MTDVVFLAQPIDSRTYVALHRPCKREEVRVGLPPAHFGHTVLHLVMGPDSFLVKVSVDKGNVS